MQPTVARGGGGGLLHRQELRGQPCGHGGGGGEVREREAGCATDQLPGAGCRRAAAAVDGVEGVLVRGDQRAFGGGERHDEIALRVLAADVHRTGDADRHLGVADEAFDAARQARGIRFICCAADRGDRMAIAQETRATRIARLARGIGGGGQAARAGAAVVVGHGFIVCGAWRVPQGAQNCSPMTSRNTGRSAPKR